MRIAVLRIGMKVNGEVPRRFPITFIYACIAPVVSAVCLRIMHVCSYTCTGELCLQMHLVQAQAMALCVCVPENFEAPSL